MAGAPDNGTVYSPWAIVHSWMGNGGQPPAESESSCFFVFLFSACMFLLKYMLSHLHVHLLTSWIHLLVGEVTYEQSLSILSGNLCACVPLVKRVKLKENGKNNFKREVGYLNAKSRAVMLHSAEIKKYKLVTELKKTGVEQQAVDFMESDAGRS